MNFSVLYFSRFIIFFIMKEIKVIKNPDHLLSYWKSQIFLCAGIVITGLLYNFGMLFNPYFEGVLIDEISKKENTIPDIAKTVVIFLSAIFLCQAVRALKRYFVRRFANNSMTVMRKNLYNNIMNSSAIELENIDIGTILTRLQSDCEQSVEGMRKLTTEIFDTVFLFLFYIVYLFLFDVKMTLIALIPVSFAILFAFLMRRKTFSSSAKAKKMNAKLSTETFSLVDHSLMFLLYSRDKENLKRYDALLKEYEKESVIANLFTDITLPVSNVIALLGLIPILYLGTSYVLLGKEYSLRAPFFLSDVWTIGSFSTYISTFILLASKASHTAKLFSSVEKGLSSWKRIKPYIKPYLEYPKAEALKGDELEIHDLTLSVEGKDLIKDFDLKAKKGEIIALTGAIASGKSAFGKVFLKELPYKGKICLFGKELSSFTLGEIKGNIVYMGHESQLLTKTIKENIAYGDENDVLPYLDMVSFSKDFNSMPEKEETLVGNEGVKLSGGQQERIALARTFYHKKGLMILDDPFASVDLKTEHQIMKCLREEAEDCIILFLSHRLSYFPYCDKVMVINPDHSVSIGKHEELLEKNKTYQELYKLQFLEVKHE